MSEKNIHPEDQIDLSGVRAVFYGLLRAFFKCLSFIGLVIRRNKYVISLSLALGMALGYIYYAKKPSHYKATMVVRFNMLTKEIYGEMVEQLNHLIAYAPRARLARDLQVSQNVSDKLIFVEAQNLDNGYLVNDTSTKIDQPFKITISLRDDYDFALDTLQTGILNYLNGSPFLKAAREQQTEMEQFRLESLDKDLAKLDTLKTEYNRFLASSRMSATFYNNASNPADFYSQTLNLLLQREATIESLKVDSLPVVVMDGFKLTERPGPGSIPRLVILFGIVAGVITFLVAFMVEARRRIMKPGGGVPTVPAPAASKQ